MSQANFIYQISNKNVRFVVERRVSICRGGEGKYRWPLLDRLHIRFRVYILCLYTFFVLNSLLYSCFISCNINVRTTNRNVFYIYHKMDYLYMMDIKYLLCNLHNAKSSYDFSQFS